jgi:hypothetical protein
MYVVDWPRQADFGVVAEVDGVPAGAWARLVRGYGFVADAVPESLGFVKVGVVGTSDTMALDL